MNDELIKELSRLQLLSSRCKNKMSMCPLSITREENRAYLIFNYIKELKEEKQEWINLLDMFKNQQKEFIELLEKEIVDSKAGSSQQYYAKEHLSKYKSIIGDSNE